MERLLEKIKIQSKVDSATKHSKSKLESGTQDPNKSALIAIKISIERILEELLNHEALMKLIKTFTYFDETNMSQELLVACAETYQPDFAMVCFYEIIALQFFNAFIT